MEGQVPGPVGLSAAARRNGLSLLGLLARLVKLRLLEGYDPREALFEGVADPNVPPEVLAGCISKRRCVRLQASINPLEHWRMTEEKGVFYRLCEEKGIPTPRLLGLLDEKDGWTPSGGRLKTGEEWGRFLKDRAQEDFVIKPSFGAYGRGLRLFSPRPEGYLDPAGKIWSAAQILADVRSDKRDRRYVIQSRITSHPEAAKLSGSPYLQTVRVLTFIDSAGAADAYFAHFKPIVGKNFVDNIDSGRTGNIMCTADVDTGVLLSGIGWRPDGLGSMHVERHPDTGIPIAGFQLPLWQEVLALAKRAQRAFLPHRCIGWDVAITSAGPMIVEGNIWWDPENVHVIKHPRLGKPRSMANLLRLLRAV